MHYHQPTVEEFQQLTRIHTCAGCEYRCPRTRAWNPNAARRCESNCPLFVHLPILRETARQLDPMVSDRLAVLGRMVTAFVPGRSRKARVLRANGMQVAKRLDELSPG